MIYGLLAALREPAVWAVLVVTLACATGAGWWVYRTHGYSVPATVAAVLFLGTALALTVAPAEEFTMEGGMDRWSWFVGQFTQADMWSLAVVEFGHMEQLANLALFAPAAFFAVIAMRQWVVVAIGGVVLAFAVESWQAIIMSRSATAVDVAANAIGIEVATIIAALIVRRRRGAMAAVTTDTPPVDAHTVHP